MQQMFPKEDTDGMATKEYIDLTSEQSNEEKGKTKNLISAYLFLMLMPSNQGRGGYM